jgi:hypothetical protein
VADQHPKLSLNNHLVDYPFITVSRDKKNGGKECISEKILKRDLHV